jgi:hypothetical protein
MLGKYKNYGRAFMNNSIRNILLFFLFVLLQVFILERIQLGPFCYPCVYVLFLIMLPFGYSTTSLLLWAFALGLSVDIGSGGVLGLHASACLCLGFFRNTFLKLVSTKGDFEQWVRPGLGSLGGRRFTLFLLFSLLTHHTVLFALEGFRVDYLHLTLLRIGLSVVVNILLIVSLQWAFFNRRKGAEF